MLNVFLAILASAPPTAMPRVEIAADKKGFLLAGTTTPFRPWGLNYGNAGRLIEDFWADEWPTVEADFRAMKAIGTNVVRVHLQVGKFMTAADKPDAAPLDRLGKLLTLAEQTGLYLDLTSRPGTMSSPNPTAGRCRRDSGRRSPSGAPPAPRSSATT
jgi:beta-galactosidase GanA